jgi:hypothetical protein
MPNNLLAAFDQAYQNLQFQPLITQEELDKSENKLFRKLVII